MTFHCQSSGEVWYDDQNTSETLLAKAASSHFFCTSIFSLRFTPPRAFQRFDYPFGFMGQITSKIPKFSLMIHLRLMICLKWTNPSLYWMIHVLFTFVGILWDRWLFTKRTGPSRLGWCHCEGCRKKLRWSNGLCEAEEVHVPPVAVEIFSVLLQVMFFWAFLKTLLGIMVYLFGLLSKS